MAHPPEKDIDLDALNASAALCWQDESRRLYGCNRDSTNPPDARFYQEQAYEHSVRIRDELRQELEKLISPPVRNRLMEFFIKLFCFHTDPRLWKRDGSCFPLDRYESLEVWRCTKCDKVKHLEHLKGVQHRDLFSRVRITSSSKNRSRWK